MAGSVLFDIIIGILILIPFAYGLWKGILSIVFSLATLIISFFAASQLYKVGSDVTANFISNAKLAEVASFAIIFVIVIIVCTIIFCLIRKALEKTPIKVLSKFIGGVVGIIVGILFVSVIVLILTLALSDDSKCMEDSYLAPRVMKVSNALVKLVPESLKESYNDAKDKLFNGEDDKPEQQDEEQETTSGDTFIDKLKQLKGDLDDFMASEAGQEIKEKLGAITSEVNEWGKEGYEVSKEELENMKGKLNEVYEELEKEGKFDKAKELKEKFDKWLDGVEEDIGESI